MDWLVALTVAAQFLVFSLILRNGQISHDVGWYLVATAKWLDGAELYRDVIEVNPPLNFYWTAPVVIISRWTGLGLHASLYAFLGLLSWVSLLWVWSILRRIDALATIQKLIMLQLLILAVFWITISQPGQREHELVLCTLPFVFSLFAAQHGVRLSTSHRVAVALFAVLGVALKHYFVLLPLTIAIAEAISARSFRKLFKLEYWVMLGGCVFYVGYVWVVHPTYLSDLVPMALAVYDIGFGETLDFVMERLPLFIFALPLLIHLYLVRTGRYFPGAVVLMAAATGNGLSYYLQFAGFDYHLFPFFIYGFLYFAYIVIVAGRVVALQLSCIAGAIVMALVGSHPHFYHETDKSADFRQFLERLEPDITVLSLSTYLSASFPTFVDPRYHWASRFPSQWLLPGALIGLETTDCNEQAQLCQQFTAIADYTRRADIEDLRNSNADVVAMDTDHWRLTTDRLDFETFLAEDPAFSELWSRYEYLGRSQYFKFWKRR